MAADWALRAPLLAALVVLGTTALVVNSMPVATRPVSAATHKAHRHKVHLRKGKKPAPTAATAPVVPGSVTGAVTEPHAHDPCGLSLAATAVSAPVGQCTVLEIGDSLGNDLGWGLQREVSPGSGLRLIQMDKSASGLANTSFYDWPVQLAAYLRQYHPQLVLISLGGDDEQGMWVNGSAVQFPTPAWQSAYRDRVRQLAREATASGAYLLWVGMPVMQPPNYNQGIDLLDSICRTVVPTLPNATFVSTWTLFANPQGAFQADAMVNGQSAVLREQDGIHYSYIGENVVATYVLRELAQIYHVQIAPRDPAVITAWQ